MKTNKLISGKNLFMKIAVLVALIVGGGNSAWGEDVVYFNATADISGWTKSKINYRAWSDKNLYLNGTGGTLTSNDNISFAKGETFVITAKGYSTKSTEPPQIIVKISSDNGSSWNEMETFSYSNGDLDLSNGEYKDVVVSGIEGEYKIQLVCDYILISSIKKVASSLSILVISSTNGAFGNLTADANKVYTITNNIGSAVTITPSIEGSNMFSVSPDDATEIANGATQDFTVTFDWEADLAKFGEKTATISFTPDNGDDPFVISASANATADVILDENSETTWTNGNGKSVLLYYQPSVNWNTICVPFRASTYTSDIFGSDAGTKYYEVTGYDNGTITLTYKNFLSVSKPYIVYVEKAKNNSGGVLLTSVSVDNTTPGTTNLTIDEVSTTILQGTYTGISMYDIYGLTPSGKIMKGGSSSTLKGFRAYFTNVAPPTGETRIGFVIEGDDETTDLGFVKMFDESATDTYNLQGQKVQKGRKGIYIVNGRKVVIK